jgi:glycosyltransferase involved in cell wall biosynthesis
VRHRILVLSFSPIARDARVMRHVRALAQIGDVVTCGFGPTPPGTVEHLRVEEVASLPQTAAGVAMLATRRLRRAERSAPAVRLAGALLRGRSYDLVVANDARALPTAFDAAAGAPVWADMHEWAPQERSHDWRWRLLVGPLATHLCRTYLPRAAAVTTVSEPIAAMYRSSFGVECSVVRNAAPFVDLSPSPVEGDRVRLVHSGGAVPGRDIEGLIEATTRLPDRFTLDLYLVPGGDGGRYLRQLRAAAVGHDRVRFHAPVAPEELPAVLNRYDVGVYSIPPTNVNMANALPNKFFDFVQARLALVVGPTPEMARLVRENGLGLVAVDFGAEALVRALQQLDRGRLSAAKAASDAAACELSAEQDGAHVRCIAERLTRGE